LWNKETATKITSFIEKGVHKQLGDIIPMYESLNDFAGIPSLSSYKKAYMSK